jgi:hypothetical protein
MSQTLRVSLESPQSGWMSLSLRAGEDILLMGASCAPYDSLRDLIEGLNAMLDGHTEINVKWNCEPEEFDFRLAAVDDRASLNVVRYPDHRRTKKASRIVFSFQGAKLDICLPFWRALRDLRRRISTDVFDSNWRREFPQRELQQLTKQIRALKREGQSEGKRGKGKGER